MKEKVYLICPVRNISEQYRSGIAAEVHHLEKQGYLVYWPARDTEQDMKSLEICEANLQAIKDADEVHFIWNGLSHGCMFDLGIAFALGKRIKPVTGYVPSLTVGKSFQNVVYALDEKQSWAETNDDKDKGKDKAAQFNATVFALGAAAVSGTPMEVSPEAADNLLWAMAKMAEKIEKEQK